MSLLMSKNDQIKLYITSSFDSDEDASAYFGLSKRSYLKYINNLDNASSIFKIKVSRFISSSENFIILSETEYLKQLAYRCLYASTTRMTLFHDMLRDAIKLAADSGHTEIKYAFEICLYISIYRASGDAVYFKRTLMLLRKVRDRAHTPLNISVITHGLIFSYMHFNDFVLDANSKVYIEEYIDLYKSNALSRRSNPKTSELIQSFEMIYNPWTELMTKLYGSKCYEYFVHLGNVYFRVKDYRNALKNYTTASQYTSSTANKMVLPLNLAITYFELGDYDLAMTFINEAIIHVSDDDPRIHTVYLNAAEMIGRLGNHELAKAYLGQIKVKDYLRLDEGSTHLISAVFDSYVRDKNTVLMKEVIKTLIESYAGGELKFRNVEKCINLIKRHISENHDATLITNIRTTLDSIYNEFTDDTLRFLCSDFSQQCLTVESNH